MVKGEKRSKLILIAYIMLVLSPVLLLAMQSLFIGKNLFLGVPTWSDELDYYRELYSFSENGFSFGGSLFAGYNAKIGPFGAHSFSPILVWGPFSVIFPWTIHSILIINLLLLSLSWCVFVCTVKPQGSSLFYAYLLAFLFSPLCLYLHTSMLEIPVYAFLIIYFCVFRLYMINRKESFFWLLMCLGLYITFIRITYIVVLFPAIWAKTNFEFSLKTLRNMAIYVISFWGIYKFYNLFCADYPDWTTSKISSVAGINGKIKVILWNIKGNVVRYFGHESNSQLALRLSLLLIVLLLLLISFLVIKNGKVSVSFNPEPFSFFVMAAGLMAMMVALYDIKDWRDYRTFAPILYFLFLYIYFFNPSKDSKVTKWSATVVFVLLMLASTNKLFEGRDIVYKATLMDTFNVVDDERPDGKPTVLVTSFDINWGDISLMQSIPSKVGFQTFYKGTEAEFLDRADYVLLSEAFTEENPDIMDRIVYITKVEGYGLLYEVR